MRRLLSPFSLVVALSLSGQDAPPPLPPAVPQAVKALQHLKPQRNSGPTSWTNGPYDYDGAGNIQAIGGEAYVYDKVGRMTSATLRGPDLSAMQTQTFEYDTFGNLISTYKLGQTVLLPVTTSTNQLNTLHYDSSGNVDVAGAQHYVYDSVGMLNTVHFGNNQPPRIIYAYTADDERLFTFDVSTGVTHWTLRGLDNKVLRDFKQNGATWSVHRDYVYRDGLLLAALKSSGAVEHYTLDHLGTPRLITDGSGHKIGYHVYWPYGEEWTTGSAQEGNPLKFTGHERDADPTGGSAPLDYMHARYYGAGWGRFLSVDPVMDLDEALYEPQMWNRYAYARNSPVSYVDRDGKQAAPGQYYVIGQGWVARSVLDPANRPTPEMAAQYMGITVSLLPIPGEALAGRLLGRVISGVGARIDAAIGGRLLEMGVNRVGKWFEGIVAKGLGSEVKAFDKTVLDAAGKRVGQIDIETSKHIIEVTLDSTGKTKQAGKLVGSTALNPEGKQVIIYGPNITKAAQRSIEKTGARVIRDYDELVRVVNQH